MALKPPPHPTIWPNGEETWYETVGRGTTKERGLLKEFLSPNFSFTIGGEQ